MVFGLVVLSLFVGSNWPIQNNSFCAKQQPSVIDGYLEFKIARGRIADPFLTCPSPYLHLSRFGVIPKNNQPGKWQLILDHFPLYDTVSVMA